MMYYIHTPTLHRWMLGLAALPALLQAVLLAALPESPRWLMAHGKAAAAQQVLRKLRGDAYVADELKEQHDDAQTVCKFHACAWWEHYTCALYTGCFREHLDRPAQPSAAF